MLPLSVKNIGFLSTLLLPSPLLPIHPFHLRGPVEIPQDPRAARFPPTGLRAGNPICSLFHLPYATIFPFSAQPPWVRGCWYGPTPLV